MYNKSEIMKRAWQIFKSGTVATFGEALRQSWQEAKGTDKATKIKELETQIFLMYMQDYLGTMGLMRVSELKRELEALKSA